MNLTETEKLIQQLNYSYTSRLSNGGAPGYTNSTYPSAIRSIASLYMHQLPSKTSDEILDFRENLSLVVLLDNASSYEGINQIPLDFNNALSQRLQEHTEINIERVNEGSLGRTI